MHSAAALCSLRFTLDLGPLDLALVFWICCQINLACSTHPHLPCDLSFSITLSTHLFPNKCLGTMPATTEENILLLRSEYAYLYRQHTDGAYTAIRKGTCRKRDILVSAWLTERSSVVSDSLGGCDVGVLAGDKTSEQYILSVLAYDVKFNTVMFKQMTRLFR